MSQSPLILKPSLRKDRGRRAVTLIELMMVVAVLSLMLGATALSLNDGGRARSVGGSVPTVAGVLGAARNEALASGKKVRLVIDSAFNSSRPDSYLRRYMLVRESTDGSTTTWEQISKPASLPKGVFFSPEYSVPTGEMSQSFGQLGSQFYYYEFDETGQLTPTASGTNSARVVITAGLMQNGTLTVPTTMRENRDGVMVHRLGRVSYFQSPSEIQPVTP